MWTTSRLRQQSSLLKPLYLRAPQLSIKNECLLCKSGDVFVYFELFQIIFIIIVFLEMLKIFFYQLIVSNA